MSGTNFFFQKLGPGCLLSPGLITETLSEMGGMNVEGLKTYSRGLSGISGGHAGLGFNV